MLRTVHVVDVKIQPQLLFLPIQARDKFAAYVNENVLAGQKPLPMFHLNNGTEA